MLDKQDDTLNPLPGIDEWEGTSGTSADVPGVGLEKEKL